VLFGPLMRDFLELDPRRHMQPWGLISHDPRHHPGLADAAACCPDMVISSAMWRNVAPRYGPQVVEDPPRRCVWLRPIRLGCGSVLRRQGSFFEGI